GVGGWREVLFGSIFFFSSGRRHTRLQGDWSSDVCSSDLGVAGLERAVELEPRNARALHRLGIVLDRLNRPAEATRMYRRSREARSEERRVGKECRARWGPHH